MFRAFFVFVGFLSVLTLSPAMAKEAAKQRKPNSGDGVNNFNIRCEGINDKGVKAGWDLEFDPADRLASLTSFENESTAVVDVKTLGAPSSYVSMDAAGRKLLVFGFKTFNDGLEEDISIRYVDGLPKMTVIRGGARVKSLKNGACRIL